jgi:hypothetical protein
VLEAAHQDARQPPPDVGCLDLRRAIDGWTRANEMVWLTGSPLLARFATDLAGLTDSDPQAAHWVARVVLSLMYWPAGDDETERQVVQRFVAPAFT